MVIRNYLLQKCLLLFRMIEESLKSVFVQFNFFIHNLAQMKFSSHQEGALLSFVPKTYRYIVDRQRQCHIFCIIWHLWPFTFSLETFFSMVCRLLTFYLSTYFSETFVLCYKYCRNNITQMALQRFVQFRLNPTFNMLTMEQNTCIFNLWQTNWIVELKTLHRNLWPFELLLYMIHLCLVLKTVSSLFFWPDITTIFWRHFPNKCMNKCYLQHFI